jgi:hypothetical protein
MHLCDRQPAFQKQLQLLFNLLIVDNVTIFDLNRMIMMHSDGARPEVPDPVRAPFEFTANRAIREQGGL